MLNFLKYLLLAKTLLENYSIIHLINSKDLLKLKSFIKVAYNKCVKANSFSLLILKLVWRGAKETATFYRFWRVRLALHVTAKGIYIPGFCTSTYTYIHSHIHF